MKINQPKIWTNQKHNFFHIPDYLDNFNSQDLTLWSGVQSSRLLDFSYNECENTEERSTLLEFGMFLSCQKSVVWNQPFPEASQYLTLFLDCSENLGIQKSLLYHVTVFHRTWQHLSWSLLLLNCVLPCGVRSDTHQASWHTSTGEALEQFRSSLVHGSQTTEALQSSEDEIMLAGRSCW